MTDESDNEKKIGSLVKGKNSAADLLTGKVKPEPKAESSGYSYDYTYDYGYSRRYGDDYSLGGSHSYTSRRNYGGTTQPTGRSIFDDAYLEDLQRMRKDQKGQKQAKPKLPFAPSDGTVRFVGEKAYMARATLERIVIDTMKLVDEMMSSNKVVLDARDRDKIKASIRNAIYGGYGEDEDGIWTRLVIE
jgi:hypothetical protein